MSPLLLPGECLLTRDNGVFMKKCSLNGGVKSNHIMFGGKNEDS